MSVKRVSLNDPIPMTRGQLITIIEDAFIDGWKTHDSDWAGPEAYLKKHKEYNESSETTIAIDNLKEGND